MYKRHVRTELEKHLKIFPAVLLTGARQTGKTTLVEEVAQSKGYHFVTLDDDIALSSAIRDPAGWLASLPKPVIIDEIQRAPEIFLPMKLDIDKNRKPGRYLLTGSSNPFLSPDLADSLAGRMGILNLYPLSQGELHGSEETFINKVFANSFEIEKVQPLTNLIEILLQGGFPPVQSLDGASDVQRWFKSYLQTMLERDIVDISNIEGLREIPRLLQLLATRSSMILNAADLSRTLGMVTMTLSRYMSLLEAIFFIHYLPGWYSNLGKRITKSSKLHLCDTAMMAQLMDVNATRLQKDSALMGHFLETFAFNELHKQNSWLASSCKLFHFRDGDYAVDLVLEKPDQSIVGIEVKTSRSLHADDLKGLRHLQKIAGNHFKRGIVLHQGTNIEFLGDDLWACPIQILWN
ncbi:MAG TPA: ATP-binding protein [Rhabdochlamydiaceae bacterium]|nr:ATP-binding protein [Rhabdochlamydiaceae bacterium]